MQLPTRLYKYQPFTAQTLENLQQGHLWFSAAANFNDPYDCALVCLKGAFSDEDLQATMDHFVSKGHDPEVLQAQLKADGQFTDQFRRRSRELIQAEMRECIQVQLHERGVACFTEANDDLLMWSHYADGHRGFCLEFDTTHELFQKVIRVAYDTDFPRLGAAEIFSPDWMLLVQAMIGTKAECWRYEREWRVVHKEPSHKYGYWPALRGVYFGANIRDSHAHIIAHLLHGSGVKLYRMVRSDDSFALSVAKVEYTPPNYGPATP